MYPVFCNCSRVTLAFFSLPEPTLRLGLPVFPCGVPVTLASPDGGSFMSFLVLAASALGGLTLLVGGTWGFAGRVGFGVAALA